MSDLNKPEIKTYYINKNGDIHYGVVDTDQCMSTGLPSVEIFTIKQEWLDRLEELGIDTSASEFEEY